jgi:hypothetical protein
MMKFAAKRGVGEMMSVVILPLGVSVPLNAARPALTG